MQSSAASAVLKRVTIIRIACGSQPRPITVQIKQTRQGACNLQVCDSPGARVRSQKRMLGLVDRTVEPLSPVLTQDGHLQKHLSYIWASSIIARCMVPHEINLSYISSNFTCIEVGYTIYHQVFFHSVRRNPSLKA